ncbi:hypothetical protein B0T22DRAFT_271105 [Podospora appendiculata]|uniref:Uncharacterized protein n=1 Tax=Podospora appendiculata TaxID=314037 RepID=A0AAE0X440_9PEZI|nr:hypothetical protein B0T22DRAFT_271105 [Podospora appendiculata]
MSGLEPLTAFGLACGVFQVIRFTGEVYKVYRSLVQTGKPGSTTGLDAEALDEDLEQQAGQASRPLTKQDNESLTTATDCKNTAMDLKAKIDRNSGSAPTVTKGSRLKSAVQAVKIISQRSQRKQLKAVEETLRHHQSTLETRLIFQVW